MGILDIDYMGPQVNGQVMLLRGLHAKFSLILKNGRDETVL